MTGLAAAMASPRALVRLASRGALVRLASRGALVRLASRGALVRLALSLGALVSLALSLGACGATSAAPAPAPPRHAVPPSPAAALPSPAGAPAGAAAGGATGRPPRRVSRAPYAVGLQVVTFVDRSRTITAAGAPARPRTLVTLIRYPALGPVRSGDHLAATPARRAGGFPLIVFGHGFAVTPAPYAALLRAWTRAGYVVAAPLFPLENANAPGGPDESDLVNQPGDVSFLITRLLALSRARRGLLAGMVDPARIGVAGHSDGGETALAVAYDSHFLDRRVRAAVILSGARIPGAGALTSSGERSHPAPALLAVQGTADTVNPPSFTNAFFTIVPRPKYLLSLIGASHLPPYTGEQPQLRIVERVSIAFLDGYLAAGRPDPRRIIAGGDVSGEAAVTALP
jgi:dienelactone hydrolase